jgi:leucyl-tRNA synthetase
VDAECSPELARLVHGTVKKVTNDLESFGFNTAISALMVLLNELAGLKEIPREAAEKFVLLLAVFAPHLGEELWEHLGHEGSVAYVKWPVWDEEKLKVNEVEIMIQINGKPRKRIMVPVDCDQEAARKAAFDQPEIAALVEGKEIRKFIFVKGRLVNIVI